MKTVFSCFHQEKRLTFYLIFFLSIKKTCWSYKDTNPDAFKLKCRLLHPFFKAILQEKHNKNTSGTQVLFPPPMIWFSQKEKGRDYGGKTHGHEIKRVKNIRSDHLTGARRGRKCHLSWWTGIDFQPVDLCLRLRTPHRHESSLDASFCVCVGVCVFAFKLMLVMCRIC